MSWHQYAPSAVLLHIWPCLALVQCDRRQPRPSRPNHGWSSASSAVEPRRAMEEPAAQHRGVGVDGSWRGRQDGGKTPWKNESSLSSLLKHSCLLCWSSPRQADVAETDERVLGKSSEIRVRRPQHLALVCGCVRLPRMLPLGIHLLPDARESSALGTNGRHDAAPFSIRPS